MCLYQICFPQIGQTFILIKNFSRYKKSFTIYINIMCQDLLTHQFVLVNVLGQVPNSPHPPTHELLRNQSALVVLEASTRDWFIGLSYIRMGQILDNTLLPPSVDMEYGHLSSDAGKDCKGDVVGMVGVDDRSPSSWAVWTLPDS